MDARVGLLFLFVLGTSWACNARELGSDDIVIKEIKFSDVSATVLRLNCQESAREVLAAGEVSRNKEICTVCKEFVGDAVKYIAENKTQTEIIHMLQESCSKLLSFKQQCTTLVDYYAPLFFLEISSVKPVDFCRKVNLCEQKGSISQRLSKDSCEICHHAVTEALLKLKDPDTQLEIIELLLKACDAAEGYAKQCKKLVFEYGPLILINAEQFLETNDICTTLLRACSNTTPATSTTQESHIANKSLISIS